MAEFRISLEMVLRHEGGFVDNPRDLGGATNHGISARMLSAYMKQPVSVDQMKMMTLDQASHIYRSVFWDAINLSSIKSQALATVVFDLAVLRGTPMIVRNIQEIINVPVDGILGSQTIQAINQFIDPTWLGLKLIEESQLSFANTCVKLSEQIRFLPGWLRRSHDLLELLINKNKKGE